MLFVPLLLGCGPGTDTADTGDPVCAGVSPPAATLSPAGEWTIPDAYLMAATTIGDQVFVSGPGGTGDGTRAGAVWLMGDDPTLLVEGEPESWFGYSLATTGELIIAGTYPNQGGAGYMLALRPDGSQVARVTGDPGDYLGYALAANAASVWVGQPEEHGLYGFPVPALVGDLTPADAAWTIHGGDAPVGAAVTLADITGDGVDDVIHGDEWAGGMRGAVWIHYDHPEWASPADADEIYWGRDGRDWGVGQLGNTLDAETDLDGDGLADVVMGMDSFNDTPGHRVGGVAWRYRPTELSDLPMTIGWAPPDASSGLGDAISSGYGPSGDLVAVGDVWQSRAFLLEPLHEGFQVVCEPALVSDRAPAGQFGARMGRHGDLLWIADPHANSGDGVLSLWHVE